MVLEHLKTILRPVFYPMFDFFLDISVGISEKIYQGHRLLLGLWSAVLYPFGFKVYRVYSHKDYINKCQGKINSIVSNRHGKSVGLIYDIHKSPEVSDVILPDLFVAQYENLFICGNSDCIIDDTNSIVINDFASTMDTNCFANPYGVIRIQKNRCALVFRRKSQKLFSKGLSICIPGSGNLYHCLYDCIAKLFVISKYDILPDFPIIADETITKTPQLRELFDLLNKSNREVIWIKERFLCQVEQLAVISSVNEMPFQLKITNCIKTTDFKYDVDFLREMSDCLLKFKSQDIYPTRFFLSRKGFGRRSYNENEIIEIAKKHDIEVIHPETLSFRQQMSLFSTAELIVGASGAAFTNLLFCKTGSVAVCLMGIDANIPIFTGGAYVAKSKLIYLVGRLTSIRLRYKIQSPFYINPSRLDALLTTIEQYYDQN